jgi:hypothetical protein
MVELRRLWRRDPQEFGYLDEFDLRAIERAKRGAGVLAVLCAIAVISAYGGAGFAGLVVAFSALAVIGLLILALGVPAAPVRRHRRWRRVPHSALSDSLFPTFEHISEQVSWADVSPRHYDMVTRPLLVRLMASRLADRHGVDLHRHPEEARAIVGDDLWWWLDPNRPVESSSQPPGVDAGTLTRLVERLEKL